MVHWKKPLEDLRKFINEMKKEENIVYNREIEQEFFWITEKMDFQQQTNKKSLIESGNVVSYEENEESWKKIWNKF